MVFLGNPAAAGAGLTLHRSRIAVYESRRGTGGTLPPVAGTKSTVVGKTARWSYVTLLCRGTLEEAEYERLLDKADRQADLLGDPPAVRPTRNVLLNDLLALRSLLANGSP